MLCDICKQNVATVHLTQMVEGKTKKVDLCEACSKEKGVDDPTGFSLADLLLGLGAAQEMAQAAGSATDVAEGTVFHGGRIAEGPGAFSARLHD